MKLFRFFVCISVLVLISCEKPILDEEGGAEASSSTSASKSKGNVTLTISGLGVASFQTMTKGSDVEIPSHLCFAIYDMGGNRLKQVNQQLEVTGSGANQSTTDFGSTIVNLEKGTYQLVALAHSSTKNPTMTNLAKVQFSNSIGYTDTYLYHTTLTVSDEPLTLDLTLDRITALCRFVISDPIPDDVTQMRFQYKGGSGHFSALTGLGVTNSTQVVTRQVQPGQQYQVFDLYTFLHQEEGTIALTVTALTTTGEEYCAWEFEIPMAKNQITWLTGNFFSEESDPGQWRVTPNIALDKRWGNQVFYTY